MLHQFLFLLLYLGLLPMILSSPLIGALLYQWLDNLPPDQVYSVTLGDLSFITGALTFLVWLIKEKKSVPRPLLVTLLMAALLLWENVTWAFALVPEAGTLEWDRTVKVIGFAILTAQMLSTRERIEAFIWVFLLCVIYFAVPGAIKLIVSGGSGGLAEGEVVVAAPLSFFGERVSFSVILAMATPLALYLGRHATLMPRNWLKLMKPIMLGVVICFLLALVGTFARTGLFAGGSVLFMLAIRSERKLSAILMIGALILALFAFAPDSWFSRMDTIADYESEASAASRVAAWKWTWAFALEHPFLGGGFGMFVLDAGHIPGRAGWLEAHNIFFSVLGKHGFVGLALFCLLILAIYRSCAVIRKRVAHRDQLAWAADLARATQIALVAFCVGGMFVSIDGTPALYMLAGMTIGARALIEREMRAPIRKWTPKAVYPATQPAE